MFWTSKRSLAFKSSERLQNLPPYLFAEIDKRKRELRAAGHDVIDLGVGDPDRPTPGFIIEALSEAARDPNHHRYALDAGLPEFRQTIGRWFKKRFNVTLDTDKEILPLIGSKEGIAHLPLAFLNAGDVAFIPDPAYPPYRSGTLFAGGEPYFLPLLETHHFLPDLSQIDKKILKRAKLMFLNYPNNPTSAVATKEFFKEVVAFAIENKILIAQDAAYSEIGYDGYRAPSILEIEGAKDVAVEFHSLSKAYNMTGWRVGFAVGNSQALALLGKVKENVDSGIFPAIQIAAMRALEEGDPTIQQNIQVYQKRRDLFVGGLKSFGWEMNPPKATLYLWIPVPPGYTSSELAMNFLTDMHVIVTPGNGFGPNGEGYFRVSLTVPDQQIQEALNRIERNHHSLHRK